MIEGLERCLLVRVVLRFATGWKTFAEGPHRSNRSLFDQNEEVTVPQGDKSACTEKLKRKAEDIEEGYEKRGASKEEAERRAWATAMTMAEARRQYQVA